jgi:maltose alpha-D-glucosyltransferase/alpha-amylase
VAIRQGASGESDALWYKDAIIYELHLKAFCDDNADGLGDFAGLTSKLDYLRDLGVDTLWLLPFYPSPLRDDGYDIADYTDIHPNYGTLRDFEHFMREAHRRDLRVITELVLNHTSDQHPWFQRARRAPKGSSHRDFYVWSDDQTRYADARIIFKDFEVSNWSWDPVAGAFYWHRFYSHQPDLNYENPAVRRATLQLVDFWLERGVDGLRLDAVPYLYEREGTNCENLEETHKFLQTVRRHIDERFPNRMLLAEANQWPEDAVAYFGNGDECHMAFHFPVMPRLFMAIHQEDSFPITDILDQTPALPETCQWALFLRNHDELTLEMVTDEERDYMYRVYATDPQARINLGIRRRLAPLLGNHRRKIELMNGLLLSLPGTPVLYYGDEIGMGDNIYLGDRNGVRTPMQWSADRNAGFSRANPQRLYLPIVIDPEYHPEALNVEAQQNNLHSLLWWMKRLIALRKRYRAFGRGTIEFLHPENRRVLAYVRHHGDEDILVVANLSRFVQFVELDLSAFRGRVPVELFGNTRFPPVGAKPYFFTLGPHAFYWFALQPPAPSQLAEPVAAAATRPEIRFEGSWGDADLRALEAVLPDYISGCRWFGGKAHRLKSAAVTETIPISGSGMEARLALVQVQYADAGPESYALPLACAFGAGAAEIEERAPLSVVARVRRGEAAGVLHDATADPRFCAVLLDAIRRRRRFKARGGALLAAPTRALKGIDDGAGVEASILKGEQSNTSIVFGDKLILKLFRRLEAGTNPDLEIGRFLTERTSFSHTPPVAGMLTLERRGGPASTVGILQGFVPNQGDAWRYTLSTLPAFFERAMVHSPGGDDVAGSLVDLLRRDLPETATELIGSYLGTAELLGQRTAEFHCALASRPDDAEFAPESFSSLYQRSLYQSMRNRARETFKLLRAQARGLPAASRRMAQAVIDQEAAVDKRMRAILGRKLSASRIRCHGDYHLGQVLYTGKDVAIIDFEGEPSRSLSERRIKRSPLRDVAGMLRSFHYAVYNAWADRGVGGVLRPEDQKRLEPAAHFWYRCVAATFLKSYVEGSGVSVFLPRSDEELGLLLDVYMLEKALYEIGYELNSRPEWVHIPLRGVLDLLAAVAPASGGAS